MPRPRRSRGFALLITLTLLAFVVLLLVGLASYTKIETAVAGNFQKQAQARQNALLALDVALAQLQKHAGPDTRVTATAESVAGVVNQKRYYTGVWDAKTAGATPVWLVSGLETATAPSVTTAIPAASQVTLVGPNTDGSAFLANGNPGANQVVAPLQALTSVGVPGQAGATAATIGRYAWWIGDQGVKAPVALGDTTASVTYAPYDSDEARSRLLQQVSLGAGPTIVVPPTDPKFPIIFEPRAAANSPIVRNVAATNQLAFLKTTTAIGTDTVGSTALRQNYRSWSPNNFNVLADTSGTGLKRDLSLDPSPLGTEFTAWADYNTYIEAPADATSLRRRYVMQPGPPPVAPVLSYFLLSFNIRSQNGSSATVPIEARAFWKMAFWNPYTGAMVPEANLRVEITGLPNIRVDNDSGGPSAAFSLQSLFGSPLKIILPWVSTPPAGEPTEDRASWLPGRVYNWRSIQETSGTIPSDGYPSRFYSKSYTATGESNSGVIRSPGAVAIDGDNNCHIEGDAQTIRVKLFAVRATGDVELATFTSPPFDSFRTNSRPLNRSSTQFVYFFRLGESSENSAWLQTAAADPRQIQLVPPAYVYGPNGSSPAAYAEDYEDSTFPERLLDRATASHTYNEDVPVFELPRAPLLSLGALQHLALPGARPFSIGNSWGAAADINGTPAAQLFDQFFFSGLTPATTPTATGSALVLPNPLLRVAPRTADGTPTTADDLRAAPNGRSSKLLLQGGSFNLNSTNAAAWAAVLRSVRFPSTAFNYLDADAATGTAADTGETTAARQSGDAQFFRFSQSAQETFKAEPGLAAGVGNTSAANTHLFRQGMITLDADKVTALATAITTAIKTRHAASGPYRTLAEFLSPVTAGGTSLLEEAIVTAGINDSVAEFSSQFLTQGDIMTALAPVLFPRSDTFVIRTYGEAVNPTTAASEGKAWCEAIVQRTPDYFDPTQDATVVPPDLNLANQTYGRRFKVVSFRWLTRSDL